MRFRTLWFLFGLAMCCRTAMAQGDVAPVQSPTVAQAITAVVPPASSAPTPSSTAATPDPAPTNPEATGQRHPRLSYMPDLPEPKTPMDEYYARFRPTKEYVPPPKPAWEQSLDALFDETLPRAYHWTKVRVEQNPFLYVPLILCGMTTSYFSLAMMGLVRGYLSRWRSSVRLKAERNLTSAERQRFMRGIMGDVVKHTQAKLKFETGYYEVAQLPPRRKPTPYPTDLS